MLIETIYHTGYIKKKKHTAEQELNSCPVKKVRCKVDGYGCMLPPCLIERPQHLLK